MVMGSLAWRKFGVRNRENPTPKLLASKRNWSALIN